jgi:uncharacterized protein (DUF2267 family)
MPDRLFRDRRDAGAALAGLLDRYRGRPDVMVLGLPRGGVPVAAGWGSRGGSRNLPVRRLTVAAVDGLYTCEEEYRMVDTGFATFSTTVDKTNRLLKEIEQSYGWPPERRNQSYAALRAVLHALRDRLTVDESAQFAAQLPMLVRGVYYDGWDPSRVPRKMTSDEFLRGVRQAFPYDVKGGIEQLIQTVLHSLRRHVTEGEWEDIKASLPKELTSVLA